MQALDIDKAVQNWYSDFEHWADSSKSSECIDYQLINLGDLVRNKCTLNLGCFYPTDELKYAAFAKRWVAIDFSSEVIERCKQLVPGVEFFVMDMRALQFENAIFDVVLDFSSGDQMDEKSYHLVLSEVYRVLCPEGYFAVAFTNRNKFTEFTKDNPGRLGGDCGYTHTYLISEMIEMLHQHGLKVIQALGEDDWRAGCLAVKE
jgi:SAM-dependent methyltransferase